MAVPQQPPFALLRERERSLRPWLTSALCAFALYGGLLAGALYLSVEKPPVRELESNELVVTLLDAPRAVEKSEPAPEQVEPAAPSPAPAAALRATRARPTRAAEPVKVEPAVPKVVEPVVSEPAVALAAATPAEPKATGPSELAAVKAATGATAGGGTGAAGTSGAGTGAGGGRAGAGVSASADTIQPFTDGMTRPSLLSHVDPVYTREALAAGVEGLILSKCVITTRGELKQCRIVKGLQYMDAAVLKALAQWRYTPVVYQGKPVTVEYVIPVRLVRP